MTRTPRLIDKFKPSFEYLPSEDAVKLAVQRYRKEKRAKLRKQQEHSAKQAQSWLMLVGGLYREIIAHIERVGR